MKYHEMQESRFSLPVTATNATSGIELETEEAKENERSPSVAVLCAGLLRRVMVYVLERV